MFHYLCASWTSHLQASLPSCLSAPASSLPHTSPSQGLMQTRHKINVLLWLFITEVLRLHGLELVSPSVHATVASRHHVTAPPRYCNIVPPHFLSVVPSRRRGSTPTLYCFDAPLRNHSYARPRSQTFVPLCLCASEPSVFAPLRLSASVRLHIRTSRPLRIFISVHLQSRSSIPARLQVFAYISLCRRGIATEKSSRVWYFATLYVICFCAFESPPYWHTTPPRLSAKPVRSRTCSSDCNKPILK